MTARKAYRTEGPVGLISKRRGRASNRRKPEVVRREALSIIRERYWDFGPTLAAEKLREMHQIMLGRETLRLWMIEAGIWADRKQRRKQVHQPRHRRDCVGELVQIDGCEHWWFEDRGPQCTLLVFVDDATSRLMHLQFVESESTFAHLGGADPRSPLAAPIYADLKGLAPLLIQVGAAETLLDDAIRLAKAAGAADVRVDLQIWPEMVHVWHMFHPELKAGKRALQAGGDYIRALMAR